MIINDSISVKVLKRLKEKHPGEFDVYTDKQIKSCIRYISIQMSEVLKSKHLFSRDKFLMFANKRRVSVKAWSAFILCELAAFGASTLII